MNPEAPVFVSTNQQHNYNNNYCGEISPQAGCNSAVPHELHRFFVHAIEVFNDLFADYHQFRVRYLRRVSSQQEEANTKTKNDTTDENYDQKLMLRAEKSIKDFIGSTITDFRRTRAVDDPSWAVSELNSFFPSKYQFTEQQLGDQYAQNQINLFMNYLSEVQQRHLNSDANVGQTNTSTSTRQEETCTFVSQILKNKQLKTQNETLKKSNKSMQLLLTQLQNTIKEQDETVEEQVHTIQTLNCKIQQLNAKVKQLSNAKSSTAELTVKTVDWCWDSNDKSSDADGSEQDHLVCYPANISQQIEQLSSFGFFFNPKTVQYSCSGNKQQYMIYRSSIDKGYQMNANTKKKRNIYRQLTNTKIERMKYPVWWTKNNRNRSGGGLKKILPPSHMEYVKVAALFYNSVPKNVCSIDKIESIENPRLWQRYYDAKCELLKDVGPNNMNQLQLFHGSSQFAIESIVHNGFLRDFSENAQYGYGTYFAVNAKRSLAYTKAKGASCILLCNVLCGESCIGNKQHSLKNWPQKQTHMLYDSLVDRKPKSNTYVIHDDHRIYPLFLIWFKIK